MTWQSLLYFPFIVLPFIKGGRYLLSGLYIPLYILLNYIFYFVTKKKQSKVITTKFDLYIYLFLIWLVLSVLNTQVGFLNSLKTLSILSSFILLFYLFLNIKDYKKTYYVVNIITAIISFANSIAILFNVNIFTNQNHTACFQVIGFYSFIFLLFNKKLSKYLFLPAFIVLISIIELKSRAAILSLWITTFILICFKHKKIKFIFIILYLLLTFAFISKNTNLTKYLKTEDNLAYSRFKIYQSAISIIKKNPVFGVGFNNFQIAYKLNKKKIFNGISNYSHNIRFVHNEILEIITETGIPTFIILLSFLIFIMYNFYIKKLHIKDIHSSIIFLAITIHSLFEFNLHLPIIGLFFIFSLVSILKINEIFIEKNDSLKKLNIIIVLIIISSLIYHLNIGKKQLSIKEEIKDPYNPFVYSNLAILHINNKNFDKAWYYLKHSLKLEPNYLDSYYKLADICIINKKYKQAEVFLKYILNVTNNINVNDNLSKYDKKLLSIDLSKVYNSLSGINYSLKEYKKALNYLDLAIELNNNNEKYKKNKKILLKFI